MSAGHILVIAPNPDFRRSLVFALESEGYSVTTQGGLTPLPGEHYDAIVLDQKAVRGAPPGDASTTPVVLLTGHPRDLAMINVFRAVPTPLAGDVLIAAVADAVAAGGTHHP